MYKQTFVIELNGLTAVACCWQITLVNSTCNIHLALQFGLRSSYEQPARENTLTCEEQSLIKCTQTSIAKAVTHRFLLVGFSCWWKAMENPNRLPGSPLFCRTFWVSRLNAAARRCHTHHRHTRCQHFAMFSLTRWQDLPTPMQWPCSLKARVLNPSSRKGLAPAGADWLTVDADIKDREWHFSHWRSSSVRLYDMITGVNINRSQLRWGSNLRQSWAKVSCAGSVLIANHASVFWKADDTSLGLSLSLQIHLFRLFTHFSSPVKFMRSENDPANANSPLAAYRTTVNAYVLLWFRWCELHRKWGIFLCCRLAL